MQVKSPIWIKLFELSIIEHFVFALPSLSILLSFRLMKFDSALIFIVAISLFGITLSTGLIWLIAKGSNWVNLGAAVKTSGTFPGQAYGALLGGMVGYRQFGETGGILLSIISCVAGLWVGYKVAEFLAQKLNLLQTKGLE